jgi:hypothetical protein
LATAIINVQQTEAFISEKLTITAPLTTGQQTYTLNNFAGVTPKAVFVVSSYLDTQNSASAFALLSTGYATGPNNQFVTYTRTNSDQATSQTTRAHSHQSIAKYYQGVVGGNQLLSCEFVSFGTNSFTVNWSVVPGSGLYLHFLVLGGSDFQGHVGVYQEPDADGIQSYGGAPFTPNVALFNSIALNTAPPALTYTAIQMLGMTDGINQTVLKVYDSDGVATTDAVRESFNDRVLMMGGYNAGPKAEFDSFYNGGVKLNWTLLNGNYNYRYFGALLIKAPNAKIINAEIGGTTGLQSITGVGFQPNTLIGGWTSRPDQINTVVANALINLGLADQDGNTANVGVLSMDDQSTSSAWRYQDTSLLSYYDSTFTNALKVALSQYLADGIEVNTLNTSIVGRDVYFLALSKNAPTPQSTYLDTYAQNLECAFSFQPIRSPLCTHRYSYGIPHKRNRFKLLSSVLSGCGKRIKWLFHPQVV